MIAVRPHSAPTYLPKNHPDSPFQLHSMSERSKQHQKQRCQTSTNPVYIHPSHIRPSCLLFNTSTWPMWFDTMMNVAAWWIKFRGRAEQWTHLDTLGPDTRVKSDTLEHQSVKSSLQKRSLNVRRCGNNSSRDAQTGLFQWERKLTFAVRSSWQSHVFCFKAKYDALV